jgi:hypothetical protein
MVPVCPRGASWGRYASVEGNTSHIGTTSPCRAPGGRLADAMNPEIQCARTHWIQGFMTFQLVRRIQTVMLMVPVCPESDFLGYAARPRSRRLAPSGRLAPARRSDGTMRYS